MGRPERGPGPVGAVSMSSRASGAFLENPGDRTDANAYAVVLESATGLLGVQPLV